MRITRIFALLTAASLTACGGETSAQSECTDPAAAAFELLSKQADSEEIEQAAVRVNAQQLSACSAEGLAKLSGYEERASLNGNPVSTSRVNISPLAVDITITAPNPGTPEEIVLVNAFAFAKINGEWLEATKDNPDSTIASIPDLRNGFETQLNPRLRAAGTDASIEYELTGFDEVLGQPVIVLATELPGGNSGEPYEVSYFVNEDYVILRSVVSGSDGQNTRVSEITSYDVAQDIRNPILAEQE